MIVKLVDNVLVLNLPQSVGRRHSIVNNFKQIGVPKYEFVPAVDGSTLDLKAMKASGELEIDVHKGRDLTYGEVGCVLSHRKALLAGLGRGYKAWMICEDDAGFVFDAPRLLERSLEHLPSDWDIVHLHSFYEIGCGMIMDPKRVKINDYLYKGNNEHGGALAYIVNQRGAKRLLELSKVIRFAWDGVTNWLSGDWPECAGYSGYIVQPFVAYPNGHASTILGRPEY